jgi:hypothetical protein
MVDSPLLDGSGVFWCFRVARKLPLCESSSSSCSTAGVASVVREAGGERCWTEGRRSSVGKRKKRKVLWAGSGKPSKHKGVGLFFVASAELSAPVTVWSVTAVVFTWVMGSRSESANGHLLPDGSGQVESVAMVASPPLDTKIRCHRAEPEQGWWAPK